MEDAKVTLGTIGSGAASELFEHAMRKVLDNIADVNTNPEAKREIRLTITMAPNEERTQIACALMVETKLAPPKGSTTTLYAGVKPSGERFAQEYNPVQTRLFGMPVTGGKE